MKRIKKTGKVVLIVLSILILLLYIAFYQFTKPVSDIDLQERFLKDSTSVFLRYNLFEGKKYRAIAMQKEIDSSKVNLIFVHGSIGSGENFYNYLKDKDILKKANVFAYDRLGYNYKDKNDVLNSLKKETLLLENFISNLLSDKTILVGYSYGGPVVLGSKKTYRKIILLAPALFSDVEPVPWMVSFYKWKLTRWLVPPVWKSASIEKLDHKRQLKLIENNWYQNPNTILSIHGDKDWVVPYENSLLLKKQIPNRMKLKTIKNANHGLVWSNFAEIKEQILKSLD